jgi:hypothetical protein
MDHKEQTDAFAAELDALVDRFCKEFDLTYAIAVGVLHLKAHLLCADAAKAAESENEDDL